MAVLLNLVLLSPQLCKETDRMQLLNFYRQESESKEAGCLLLSRSFVERVCKY